MNFKETH